MYEINKNILTEWKKILDPTKNHMRKYSKQRNIS